MVQMTSERFEEASDGYTSGVSMCGVVVAWGKTNDGEGTTGAPGKCCASEANCFRLVTGEEGGGTVGHMSVDGTFSRRLFRVPVADRRLQTSEVASRDYAPQLVNMLLLY